MFSGSKLPVWSLISYCLTALFTSNSAAILLLWQRFSIAIALVLESESAISRL
jgi:hypothetical protein